MAPKEIVLVRLNAAGVLIFCRVSEITGGVTERRRGDSKVRIVLSGDGVAMVYNTLPSTQVSRIKLRKNFFFFY